VSFWSRLLRGSAGDQYHRGIGLFNEGRYDEAVCVLEDVLESGGASPFAKLGAFYAAEAHAKLGLAHFHRGNWTAPAVILTSRGARTRSIPISISIWAWSSTTPPIIPPPSST
jgi:hypothetical protein